MMLKQVKNYITRHFELMAWILALILLAFNNPEADTHFSLCVFKWMGIQSCPGCGLGHSISWLFHGDLQHSLQAHPLGIFAVAILLMRIFTLSKKQLTISNK
jgi:hypothetical protein